MSGDAGGARGVGATLQLVSARKAAAAAHFRHGNIPAHPLTWWKRQMPITTNG
jgi:hypothetical protein